MPQSFFFFLSILSLSSTTRYSTYSLFILCVLILGLAISLKSLGSFNWRIIFRNQDLSMRITFFLPGLLPLSYLAVQVCCSCILPALAHLVALTLVPPHGFLTSICWSILSWRLKETFCRSPELSVQPPSCQVAVSILVICPTNSNCP